MEPKKEMTTKELDALEKEVFGDVLPLEFVSPEIVADIESDDEADEK